MLATSPILKALVAVCAERGLAVQTIKAITRAPWGDQQPTANTWYEPLTDQGAIDTAVSWVLGRDGVFLNTVGDIHILPKVIDAAERFTRRPSDEEMRALEGAFGLEPLFVTRRSACGVGAPTRGARLGPMAGQGREGCCEDMA